VCCELAGSCGGDCQTNISPPVHRDFSDRAGLRSFTAKRRRIYGSALLVGFDGPFRAVFSVYFCPKWLPSWRLRLSMRSGGGPRDLEILWGAHRSTSATSTHRSLPTLDVVRGYGFPRILNGRANQAGSESDLTKCSISNYLLRNTRAQAKGGAEARDTVSDDPKRSWRITLDAGGDGERLIRAPGRGNDGWAGAQVEVGRRG